MAWIADVVPDETISSTAWGNAIRDRVVHTFASEVERNATAVPRQGMLSWVAAENRLAIWYSDDAGWVILFEPWRPWTPVIWSGPTTNFTVTDNRGSQYRHAGFMAEVFMSVTFTLGATVDTDLIYVQPPIPPTRPGPIGSSWMRDPTNGTLGPLAVCDATHITVQQLGVPGALITRVDLADTGSVDWYLEGRYVIAIS